MIPAGLETQASAARVHSPLLPYALRVCHRVRRAVGPLAGGRRYVQGRKAQKHRACLTGRFLAPGCRG
jgi:hypothetical protein